MKQNAWNEISKTMIETNCGDFYTSEYCQRRCISLREQYNREKKRIESQFRSGSAAPKPSFRQFSLYSQLTFLDQVIKRRKTYSNVTKCQSDATLVNEDSSGSKTDDVDADDVNTSSSENKENESTKDKKIINAKSTYEKISMHPQNPKRGKINETKALEQTFLNMSNKIISFMETSNMSTANTSTADAFIELIKVQFNNMPEHEKNNRRKMIIDALSTPLPKI